MPSESQIPIASQGASKRFATRLALFYGATFGTMGTHLPFFTLWLKSVGIDASWIGIISAVPAVTRFTVLPFVTGAAGTALFAARGPDRHRDRHRARLCGDRHAISAARGAARLCRDLLPVDPDGAADGRLRARRRGALWPELRTAAAVGLGGLRGRRTGLRPAGRFHRSQPPDLGHCGGGGARRRGEPRAAAAGPAKAAGDRRARRQRLAARSRFPRHHRRSRPDPGQPRRLLRLCLHHLAGVRSGRADHRRPVGAGRARRDRGVRAVAALHAGAGAAGGDRRAQRGGALADHRRRSRRSRCCRWCSSRMA